MGRYQVLNPRHMQTAASLANRAGMAAMRSVKRYGAPAFAIGVPAVTANWAYQASRALKKGSRTEVAKNDAQPNVGYGQHDARTMFPKRRRRYRGRKTAIKRRRVNRALNKTQKKLVRKIVRRTGVPNAVKANSYIHNCLKTLDTGGVRNTQGVAVFPENTLNTGWTNAEDKGNHFNDIFTAAFVDADAVKVVAGDTLQQMDERIQRLRLKFIKSNTKFQIVAGSACPNAMVEVHHFVCKKSITKVELVGTEANSLGVINGGAVDTANKMVANAFNNKLLDRTDTDWDQITSTTPGWDPRDDSVMLKEYFTWRKTDRYNISAGTNIVIDDDHNLNVVVNNQTSLKYAFLKNISRLVVFTILGVPQRSENVAYISSGIAAQSQNDFGVYVKQEHRITWKPVYGTPDQVKDNDIGMDVMTTRGGYKGITVSGGSAIINI